MHDLSRLSFINVTMPGIEWSPFFTDNCATPISFERWELAILMRLTNEILPFNSPDARDFLDLFYFNADREARGSVYGQAYRLALVEPRALEIEQRDAGQVREGERIESELGERLPGGGVGFIVEDVDHAVADLQEVDMAGD